MTANIAKLHLPFPKNLPPHISELIDVLGGGLGRGEVALVVEQAPAARHPHHLALRVLRGS